jgi:hypothetical protein
MALQLGKLRDALIEAGASAEKAARAAEELPETRLASIKADLTLLQWMIGINLILTPVILASIFAVWANLGEIAGEVSHIAHAH